MRRLFALPLYALFAAPAVAGPPPLYDGMGHRTRPITTRSPEAQRYFDQALALLFSFNHRAAVRSFARAEELDPTCAMCAWGVALSDGPNINYPKVPPEREQHAVAAIARAQKLAANASPVEKRLIDALAKRYAWPQPKDRRPLDEAYAGAMREVWRAYPRDADVGALFAEALADVDPHALSTVEGRASPLIAEMVTVLEAVLAFAPDHLDANHMLIHAVENSTRPERAIAAADRLRDAAPGLGHLLHMPSHVDVIRGHWADAVVANQRAAAADRRTIEREPSPDDNAVYLTHDLHVLTFAAMMRGQSKLALDAAREDATYAMRRVREKPDVAPLADATLALPLEVLVRFGRWDEVLAEPDLDGRFVFSRALRHYARGVALAAQDRATEARAEQAAFTVAAQQVPADYKLKKADAHAVLAVAEKLLDGEIKLRAGEREAGLESLREAVRREDALEYGEPPLWIHPVRHALGAWLLKLDRLDEAEQVYRDDLARHPHNGWSLLGLARSLRVRKREKEAAPVEAELKEAWKDADVKLSSSCFCQPGD